MMRMAYNIIEGHACYNFPTFISNEVRKNLFNIEKFNFRYLSYLWWFIIHQNLEFMVEEELQIMQTTSSTVPTPIDLRVLVLTKMHGSYYEFMEKYFALSLRILTSRITHKLHQSIMDELHGGNKIGDWYFLKNHTIVTRYDYSKIPFLHPKYVTP